MATPSSSNTLTPAAPGKQLFVGNIPFHIQWQELKDLFKEHGAVIRADVATTPAGRSRGFGTVLFVNNEDAQAAMARFNHYEWQGRTIEVREDRAVSGESGEQRSLYVGNIPYSIGWQDLKDLFKQAGNVVRADIGQDFQGRSKGFGMILMGTPEAARNAIDKLHGYEWNGRQIEVREDRLPHESPRSKQFKATPPYAGAAGGNDSYFNSNGRFSPPSPPSFSNRNDDNDSRSSDSRQLYVGNLPFTMQWQELKDLFRQAGNVIRADVAQDAQGRSRGYGTVVLTSAYEAQTAVSKFNGTEVSGRIIEVREDKFAAEGSTAGTQVFVGNLPYSTRWQDLKDTFKQAGLNPVHADVMTDQATGRSKGCGIVRFTSREEAERAVQRLNASNIAGRNIVVRIDKFA
ncbi:hypothetical protein SeLEV6574_g04395 [Synchytrium endobioticum]|uniref:RRM domain-containing protein n=1 Tax=Synchytrium endobioticum TaxID=286115 RepID=A0A507CZK3_9FUNG|nr:hypothetical protein SeLEV6574_g04395 [Synchytrium endobioticum]